MSNKELKEIETLLSKCSLDERTTLFRLLRKEQSIHELEKEFNTTAEVILDAIHRAPELTRRMLRGVIADAAFARQVIPTLVNDYGWEDAPPVNNESFDHRVKDKQGYVTIQVKLQRSEEQQPLVTKPHKLGLAGGMWVVEVQKTRGGKSKDKDGNETKTRPYHFNDFDILAVSLYPATSDWSRFRYTVAKWLLKGKGASEIGTYQPVPQTENDDWTDDFQTAVNWLRSSTVKEISGALPKAKKVTTKKALPKAKKVTAKKHEAQQPPQRSAKSRAKLHAKK